MRGLHGLYCPDEKYEYDVFYLQQSNSIRYMRDHDNLGKSYGSTACVMVREKERNPGFRNKVKEIKKQVQSEAYNGEPVGEVDRLTAQTKNIKKHNIKKRKESLFHCSFSCHRLFDFSFNLTESLPSHLFPGQYRAF